MNPLLDTNLISTKVASQFSGYTRDYIARMARQRKVASEKIGHSWLIDRKSLKDFCDRQHRSKSKHAMALAHVRGLEYYAHKSASDAKHVIDSFRRSPLERTWDAAREQAVAFLSAIIVIGLSAVSVPTLKALFLEPGQTMMHGVQSEFAKRIGDLQSSVSLNPVVAVIERSEHAVAAAQLGLSREFIAPARGWHFDITLPRVLPSTPPGTLSPIESSFAPDTRPSAFFESSVRSALFSTLTRVTHPSIAVTVLVHSYVAFGSRAYEAINASLGAYLSLVNASGAVALQLAHAARGVLTESPKLIAKLNLAFGESVIDLAHGAIHTDVAVAYAIAAAAPESARVTVTFIGNVGDVLARGAATAPAFVVSGSVVATNAAERMGSSLSRSIFNVAYAQATRFVGFANAFTAHYLALIYDTGTVAYEGARAVRHSMLSGGQLLAAVPAAFSDAYLGVIGKTFHAFFSSADAARSVVFAQPVAGQ